MRTFLLLLLFSNTLSAQQLVIDSIQVGNVWRNYRVFLPTGFSAADEAPLVLNFHGYGSNALEQEFYSGFDQVADTAGVVVVYPNGTDEAFMPFVMADDVAFADALITKLHQQYNIDLDRVYSTGLSNGGFFSFILACELTNRLAAIADVAGSMASGATALCNPSETIPVLHIHGTADAVVPYTGNANFLPVTTVMNFWATENGCSTSFTTTPIPNTSTADGTTADRLEYNNCPTDGRTVLIRVNGGGHTWPGASFAIGVTSQDFNASVEIWRFFRQYSRAVSSVADVPLSGVTVAPNPVRDVLRVDFSGQAGVDVRLFDLAGNVLYSERHPGGAIDIPMRSFAAGTYFLEARLGAHVQRTRVVKVD